MRRAVVSWAAGRSEIGVGLVVLVGVSPRDEPATAERAADRLAQLRIFQDHEGKTNLSLQEVGGAALVVSQFTLLADVSRGRRPGFSAAAPPDLAKAVYEELITALRRLGIPVQTGSFGADMDLELVNQGPFTLSIDTDNLAR